MACISRGLGTGFAARFHVFEASRLPLDLSFEACSQSEPNPPAATITTSLKRKVLGDPRYLNRIGHNPDQTSIEMLQIGVAGAGS